MSKATKYADCLEDRQWGAFFSRSHVFRVKYVTEGLSTNTYKNVYGVMKLT